MSTIHLYDEKIRPIKSINFCVLGNDEIRRMSALGSDSLGIEYPDLYDNGEPKTLGLLDMRLGVSLQNVSCQTCGFSSVDCPGHFGHIELAEPVHHRGFIPWIKKILGCICLKCSKILIKKNEEELLDISNLKMGKQRLSDVKKATKSITHCSHPLYGCGTPVTKIKIEVKKSTGAQQIVSELQIPSTDEAPEKKTPGKVLKKVIKNYLTAEMCYDILKNISDSDLVLMGIDPKITRPEDFIHINYPFPPVAIRPSAKVDFLDSQTKEDDITLKMHDIVKANNRVRKTKESGTDSSVKYGPDAIQLLAYHISANFDNETAGALKSEQKSKATKSISARLKGKEGRIRGNLMGKRVNFSCRTVISPDPSLSMNQLRVPIKIAMNLTFPEIVTPYNIEALTSLVKNGSDIYPGANYVIPANEDLPPIFLKYAREKVNLQYGDVVERHVVDGDIILFNRQPTLHKLSMMAHKVQVINDWSINTLSFALCDTKPYNADFDGDEMNGFLPQSVATAIELEEIAMIDKQIISPKDSVPIIGIVQDGLLGAFNMTDPNIQIDRKSAMNMITYTSCEDFELFAKKDMKTVSGADLFSLIIPSKVNISGNVEIKNGKIIKGKIGKSMLAPKVSNSIIHLVYNEYGHEQTRHFLDDSQKIVNVFNAWNGFTVGIGDTYIDKEVEEQIHVLVETNKLEINYLITEMENNYDLVDADIFEQSMLEKLRTVAPDATKIAKAKLLPDNNFLIMISSGARGADENIQQICALLGQQLVENKRIQKKNNNRSLSYFHQNDDSALARGFVETPFTRGIHPAQFIYHNMGSREGLIDTAVKSVTGDTPIIILENGISKHVMIGDWIDAQLKADSDKVKHYVERELELLELTNEVYIPTCDADGRVTWGAITAITRHDPGKELYEIKTLGGREVIVTESKSLLIWDEDKKQFHEKLTPDVKLGDYVPVTMNLGVPPKITQYIDVSHYLPKTEYVYGTDFILAKTGMDAAMVGRGKIPAGWWEKNNGSTFTLPYTKKSSLTRTCVRSNIDNIKQGSVYPYSAMRGDMAIPDRLELDKDNGIFIGLFLAEGNVDIKSGYIQITNSNKNIQAFVKSWFDKMSIKHKYRSRTTDRGTTEDVRGFSTILAKLLTKLVGHGARNKYVPNEAFTAPEEFVIGLLNGYFSGDGHITDSGIRVGSVSKELVTGINMLLSRLGIFGKTTVTQQKSNNLGTIDIAPMNNISIRGQWAKIFAEKISLVDNNKHDKLQKLKASNKHKNFPEYNDVVLDKIIEINKVDIVKYPKVYDLTVPSTLNFGIANGMICADTAETGYIQRKLMKLLEDVGVKYDCTVRNANETIIQFTYGDSGNDTTKQSLYVSKFLEMNNKEIENKVIFGDKNLDTDNNKKLYSKIIKLRDIIRQTKVATSINNITFESSFMLSVNIKNIVNNEKANTNTKDEKLDVDYIIQQLNDVCEYKNTKVTCVGNSPLKYKDEKLAKLAFRFALYESLSPKICINEYNIGKTTFDKICENIILQFNKSIVEPGEMVGAIAAQSVGEPTTQMTLSSFHHAGIASAASLGVPRVKELISLSRNLKTPEIKILFNDKSKGNYQLVNKISSHLSLVTMRDISKKIDIFYDPNPLTKNGYMAKDNVYNVFYSHSQSKYTCNKDISGTSWLLRIEINREKMMEKDITLLDIKSKFCNNWEKRYSDSKNLTKTEKTILDRISSVNILSNSDNDLVPVIHIRFSMPQFDFGILTNFIESFVNNFKLKGIESINRIVSVSEQSYISFDKNDGTLLKNKHWVVYTMGVNMRDLRYINGIDLDKTLCNDIMEIYELYGIDACRAALLKEFKNVFLNAGSTVNYTHIEVLCDLMTNKGMPTSIDRHAMKGSEDDPLSRASFEKTVEHLLTAAVFGEIDHMKSVSSRIMAGLVIKGGTGMCDILLDTELLENSEYTEDFEQNYEKTYTEVSVSSIIDDTIGKDADDIFIPL